jgi:serine/threonine protein kinase
MSVEIGQQISHYKILEKLGEGGMGIVYKAEDTILKRTVALKFLPPHLTSDESTRKRFLVEAQAESALDHPNICTIHEINETSDGQLYICMAYYAGESLQQKIKQSPLPFDEAIDIFLQVSRGLAVAHEKDIVHRDIKPGNILIAEKGEVKIVDFGLAKLAGDELTKTFSTKGTIAYMAPETIRGLAADQRTDIWSLGVLLFEMLTGHLPFEEEYHESMMYAIVNKEPDSISNYIKDAPERLKEILKRLLQKNPDDRYQHVDDLIIGLQKIREENSGDNSERTTVVTKLPSIRKTAYIISIALSTIMVLTIISYFTFNPFSTDSLPTTKLIPFTTLPGIETEPAFSPDGTQIAFRWIGKNYDNSKIYVKLIGMGTQEQYRLTHKTGIESMPAWSPDGRYIAFGRLLEEGRGIYRIPARGGIEETLVFSDSNWWYNLSWSPDGKTIAFSNRDSLKIFNRICLLSIDSHQIKGLTDGPELSLNDTYCAISPDGKKVAFIRGAGLNAGDIYIVPITGGKTERLTFDNSVIYGLTWTADGQDIVFSSDRGGSSNGIWRISVEGENLRQILAGGNYLIYPTVSKQDSLLAYEDRRKDIDIFRLELPISKVKKSESSKLTISLYQDDEPRYSPDGKKIAYRSFASGSPQIWICDRDGNSNVQLTRFKGGTRGPETPYWSPDGHTITFGRDYEGQLDIFTIDVARGEPVRITNNLAEDRYPRFSHDGNWIYYNSNRSGAWQIWKIPAKGGKAIQVTENGGYGAYEFHNGNKIYYTKFDTHGIWEKSLSDVKETKVIDFDIGWANWDLAKNGIYYVLESDEDNLVIYFYDFANNKITELANLGNIAIHDFCVSPDRQWVLYSQVERHESNIMLIENFH